jgi:hypothetical protein
MIDEYEFGLELYEVVIGMDVDVELGGLPIAVAAQVAATKSDAKVVYEDGQWATVAVAGLPLAWMQRHQIEDHHEQPIKPTFNTASELAPLIDALNEQRAPGWLRGTADLLGLAGETQTRIARTITECARMTRRDGQYHEVMLSFAGMWGHPTLFAATEPPGADPEAVPQRLLTYMRAKRHQLGSDRALGLLFDDRANLKRVIYLNTPHVDSPEMDRLVAAMRLEPVGDQSRRPTPPSARRATRRLRGKRPKR